MSLALWKGCPQASYSPRPDQTPHLSKSDMTKMNSKEQTKWGTENPGP